MESLKEYQNKLIFQLAQQAFLVAKLYGILADYYPADREFWATLSVAELERASWIEYLLKKIHEGHVEFREQGLKTYTVQAFLVFLENKIAALKAEKPDPARAASLAGDIERSLIKRRVFHHFIAKNDEMKRILDGLNSKTREHCGRVIKKIDPTQRNLFCA